jgi:hypothetical protein
MMSVILALGLSSIFGLALTAGACRLVLRVMPRRDR